MGVIEMWRDCGCGCAHKHEHMDAVVYVSMTVAVFTRYMSGVCSVHVYRVYLKKVVIVY